MVCVDETTVMVDHLRMTRFTGFPSVVCRVLLFALYTGCAVYGEKTSPPGLEPVVKGTPISISSTENLFPAVAGRLLDLYADKRRIEPPTHEIRACLAQRSTPEGRNRWAKAMRIYAMAPFSLKMEDEMVTRSGRTEAVNLVRWWMVCRSLYDNYGGRVVMVEGVALPVDALRDFINDCLASRDLTFPTREYKELFLAAVDRLPDEPTVPEEETFTRMHTPWWASWLDDNETVIMVVDEAITAEEAEATDEPDAWEDQDEERRQQEEIEEKEAEEARLDEERMQAEEAFRAEEEAQLQDEMMQAEEAYNSDEDMAEDF
ncbi:MAG: hypothetical protein H7A43_05690 [Verrucomicrobia bacterium]|nr:hypothetical protein [Verrucomicrobiota bacterium]